MRLPLHKRAYYWFRFTVLDSRERQRRARARASAAIFPYAEGTIVQECEHCDGWGVKPHQHHRHRHS